jgi:prepilin-type N-terminal cleavage/methylation domain-containing protein/prepilin-type processing-associated H-X9-DG protein
VRDARRGFTLLELLIVVGIIAILLGILIPALARAKDLSKQSTCGGNLSAIAKAMALYAASAADAYPTVPPPNPHGTTTGAWFTPPFADEFDGSTDNAISCSYLNNTTQNGDPMANLWLLTMEQLVSPKVFVCPADPNQPMPADLFYNGGQGVYDNFGAVGINWPTTNTFSYSWSYPWFADDTAPGLWWRNSVDSSLPVGSDMAPSGITATYDPTIQPGQKISNSKNHNGGEGQNVLFADSHVIFSTTNRVGQNGDNIFCADGVNIYVMQGGAQFNTTANLGKNFQPPFDVIMVPAAP